MLLGELAKQPLVKRCWLGDAGQDLRGVHCDSRRVDGKTAFYALPGFREDGHAFVDDARMAGAPALFVTDAAVYERLEKEAQTGGWKKQGAGPAAIFLMEGGRAGLAVVASLVWGAPSGRMKLFGVTGTNGKTTVAHLCGQLGAAVGHPCGVLGSLGAFLPGEGPPTDVGGVVRTTPEAPDIEAFLARCLEAGVGTAAMEVTSIGIALERSRELVFTATAFTNLTQDHLDFHVTMEAYRDAKFRRFLEQPPGTAVINRDDPTGRDLVARLAREKPGLPVLTFSLDAGASLSLGEGTTDGEGSRGNLRFEGSLYPFQTGLLGRFNLSNLLAATGLMLASGAEPGALAEAMALCRGAPGRFEKVATELPFPVLVDYAHTPDALENSLRAVRGIAPGRVLALFGCGGERDRGKRPLMAQAAERLADVVAVTSDNPRGEKPENILAEITAGFISGGAKTCEITDRREAIHWILGQARLGDVVLLAGKGHETYQEKDGKKIPFDDREVVREWARGRTT